MVGRPKMGAKTGSLAHVMKKAAGMSMPKMADVSFHIDIMSRSSRRNNASSRRSNSARNLNDASSCRGLDESSARVLGASSSRSGVRRTRSGGALSSMRAAAMSSMRNMGSRRRVIKRTSSGKASSSEPMNIFASDMVSTDFILDRLRDVKDNLRVVKLEIEDLIVSSNNASLIPVVKGLLMAEDREWVSVTFVDSFPGDHFKLWQTLKQGLMKDLEDIFANNNRDDEDDNPCLDSNVITLQANVEVPSGTPLRGLTSLLRSIRRHPGICSVEFAGALFGYSEATLVEGLNQCVNEQSELTELISIRVACGWRVEPDWAKMLDAGIRAVKDLKSYRAAKDFSEPEEVRPALRRAQSAGGIRARSSSDRDIMSGSSRRQRLTSSRSIGNMGKTTIGAETRRPLRRLRSRRSSIGDSSKSSCDSGTKGKGVPPLRRSRSTTANTPLDNSAGSDGSRKRVPLKQTSSNGNSDKQRRKQRHSANSLSPAPPRRVTRPTARSRSSKDCCINEEMGLKVATLTKRSRSKRNVAESPEKPTECENERLSESDKGKERREEMDRKASNLARRNKSKRNVAESSGKSTIESDDSGRSKGLSDSDKGWDWGASVKKKGSRKKVTDEPNWWLDFNQSNSRLLAQEKAAEAAFEAREQAPLHRRASGGSTKSVTGIKKTTSKKPLADSNVPHRPQRRESASGASSNPDSSISKSGLKKSMKKKSCEVTPPMERRSSAGGGSKERSGHARTRSKGYEKASGKKSGATPPSLSPASLKQTRDEQLPSKSLDNNLSEAQALCSDDTSTTSAACFNWASSNSGKDASKDANESAGRHNSDPDFKWTMTDAPTLESGTKKDSTLQANVDAIDPAGHDFSAMVKDHRSQDACGATDKNSPLHDINGKAEDAARFGVNGNEVRREKAGQPKPHFRNAQDSASHETDNNALCTVSHEVDTTVRDSKAIAICGAAKESSCCSESDATKGSSCHVNAVAAQDSARNDVNNAEMELAFPKDPASLGVDERKEDSVLHGTNESANEASWNDIDAALRKINTALHDMNTTSSDSAANAVDNTVNNNGTDYGINDSLARSSSVDKPGKRTSGLDECADCKVQGMDESLTVNKHVTGMDESLTVNNNTLGTDDTLRGTKQTMGMPHVFNDSAFGVSHVFSDSAVGIFHDSCAIEGLKSLSADAEVEGNGTSKQVERRRQETDLEAVVMEEDEEEGSDSEQRSHTGNLEGADALASSLKEERTKRVIKRVKIEESVEQLKEDVELESQYFMEKLAEVQAVGDENTNKKLQTGLPEQMQTFPTGFCGKLSDPEENSNGAGTTLQDRDTSFCDKADQLISNSDKALASASNGPHVVSAESIAVDSCADCTNVDESSRSFVASKSAFGMDESLTITDRKVTGMDESLTVGTHIAGMDESLTANKHSIGLDNSSKVGNKQTIGLSHIFNDSGVGLGLSHVFSESAVGMFHDSCAIEGLKAIPPKPEVDAVSGSTMRTTRRRQGREREEVIEEEDEEEGSDADAEAAAEQISSSARSLDASQSSSDSSDSEESESKDEDDNIPIYYDWSTGQPVFQQQKKSRSFRRLPMKKVASENISSGPARVNSMHALGEKRPRISASRSMGAMSPTLVAMSTHARSVKTSGSKTRANAARALMSSVDSTDSSSQGGLFKRRSDGVKEETRAIQEPTLRRVQSDGGGLKGQLDNNARRPRKHTKRRITSGYVAS